MFLKMTYSPGVGLASWRKPLLKQRGLWAISASDPLCTQGPGHFSSIWGLLQLQNHFTQKVLLSPSSQLSAPWHFSANVILSSEQQSLVAHFYRKLSHVQKNGVGEEIHLQSF